MPYRLPKDKATLTRIQTAHPKLRAEGLAIYDEIYDKFSDNLGVRFTQVWRSFDEQNAMYAQGRTKHGPKVTNAKGGQSYHNYGLAIDFCLLIDKDRDGKIINGEATWDMNTDLDKDLKCDWLEVVEVFLKYGWTWGATFKDYPHFEKPFHYSWRELLDKYTRNDFIKGTHYVNI